MTRAAGLRAALVVALLVGGADAFLLWGRTLATPVGVETARAELLADLARPGPGPRPRAGVYRYRTDGHERVDRFGIDRVYPRETVRVVAHMGGCRWRETVPLLAQHTETYDFCSEPGRGDAREVAYATSLTYFLVPGVQRFACDPAGRRLLTGAKAGATLRWHCAAGGSASDNATVYLGTEAVRVGSSPVRARHLRVVVGLRGQSTGGAVRDLWLDPQGLVLREERLVHLVVRSGFTGLVTYDEQATFELVSLEPAAQ